MDAKKSSETKITKEENPDSGFLSGPIDHLPGDSTDLSNYLSKEENLKVLCGDQGDSGVILLSDLLLDVGISDKPEATQTTCERSEPLPESTDVPPITVLFEQDDDGDTSLHIAAEHGCEQSVGTLIKICPNKEWFNVCNDFGHTALHIAVMNKNPTVTRMLVLAGASIGIRDKQGETPLHKATKQCDLKCIHALLSPVKENPQRISTVLEQKNYDGQACVHVAASAGHIDTLQALVFYGADINSRENLAGWTPLHIAASRGDTRLVQYLCEKCPGVAVHALDFGLRTPRKLAKRNQAYQLFANQSDSDSETDSDDDYDSDSESLFERLRDSPNLINVA